MRVTQKYEEIVERVENNRSEVEHCCFQFLYFLILFDFIEHDLYTCILKNIQFKGFAFD